jgi:hypothetical protein
LAFDVLDHRVHFRVLLKRSRWRAHLDEISIWSIVDHAFGVGSLFWTNETDKALSHYANSPLSPFHSRQ